jgi:hypothetical protein
MWSQNEWYWDARYQSIRKTRSSTCVQIGPVPRYPFEVTNKLLRPAHSQAECLHKRRVVQGCALLLGGFLRRLAAWLQRRLVRLAVR